MNNNNDKLVNIFNIFPFFLPFFLQTAHIDAQTGTDNFVCNWKGCKVQGKTSCSRRWLERHVTSHGGNKPFVCIVESCGMRYSSQVNIYFDG